MKTEDKKQIAATIYDQCERCLITPENPFTLDNPDIIAANGNKLYAIYLPTYSESENIDYLLRRLYLSRLSYGCNLIPILLFDGDSMIVRSLNNNALNSSFAIITNSVEEVARCVNGNTIDKKRQKHFSAIQADQYILYRQRITLSENANREIRSSFSVNELQLGGNIHAKSWSLDIYRESKYFRSSQGGAIAMLKKKRNMAFRASFDQLMTLAFMSLYNLDNGELYPTNMHNEMAIVNTDWQMFDEEHVPNEYNRMLSYVGLAPVSISTNREMELLFERYQIISGNVAR